MIEPVRIPARHDGFALGGELHLPEHQVRGCALIGGAMAVRAKFYSMFARHLAEQGIAALTLDYRGIGASRPEGPLRGFTAHFHDWGEKDLAGGLDFLKARFPGLPLYFVGHSAGAQLMGMAADGEISAALFIAAGTAYWKAYRGRARAFMGALWYALLPAATAINGYLPMRLLGGSGEDVPAGVAREWAAWGKDPRYVYAWAEPKGGMGYVRWSGPIRAVSIADDTYAPRPAMESLLSLYTAARKELHVVTPQNGPIGHFGFFKKPALWPEQVAFLTAR